MTPGRVLIFAFLLLILGVPFALRPSAAGPGRSDLPTLVVVTPHVPQIQAEFGGWELARVRLYHGGVRKIVLRRRRSSRMLPDISI